MYNRPRQVVIYPRLFIATYPDFDSGFKVLRTLRPVSDTISEASKLLYNPGLIFESPVEASLVEVVLLGHTHDAGSKTGEKASWEPGNFRYITSSECRFGWDQISRGSYTFFVNVWDFPIPKFRKQMKQQLFQARWTSIDVIDAHKFIADRMLTPLFR